MHEISVMTQIVESAIEEIKRHKLKNVDKIYLEIGELTFLGEEQLKFAYSLLTEKTILEKTKLIITKRKAEIECKRCGYKGALAYSYNDSLLMSNPTEKPLAFPRNVRNAKHSVVVNEYTRNLRSKLRSMPSVEHHLRYRAANISDKVEDYKTFLNWYMGGGK